MGQVFKKAFTKPIPAGAEFLTRKNERIARWRDSKGKIRTAPVTIGNDGSDRLALESRTYFARYRDGDGIVVECSTECHDEGAARAVLADLERRAERVKSGLLSTNEDRISRHRSTTIGEHFQSYMEHTRASGTTPLHQKDTLRYLKRLAAVCGFARLADFARDAAE